MKYLKSPVITFALLLVLLNCCIGQDANTKSKDQDIALPVVVENVRIQDVPYLLETVGTLEAEQEVTVAAEVAGKVDKIGFQEGQRIEKGTLLYKLDDAQHRYRIQIAKADIKGLEIEIENLKREADRKETLFKQDLIPKKTYEDKLTEFNSGKASLEAARGRLLLAKDLLSKTRIVSPISGIAGERKKNIGDYVAPGTPVVRIVKLDPIKVSFHIPERYISAIQIGQMVTVRVEGYPEKIFEGLTYFIDPEIDEKSRSLLVKARLENKKGHLTPGAFVRVAIRTKINKNSMVISKEAIKVQKDKSVVFVLEEGRARQRQIILGKELPDGIEVLEGIREQEMIITKGKKKIQDGAKVKIVER